MSESLDESVAHVLAGHGGTMGAVADGLARMGLGKGARVDWSSPDWGGHVTESSYGNVGTEPESTEDD